MPPTHSNPYFTVSLGREPQVARRILVVDDDRPSQLLLTRLLEAEGFEVRTAEDGEEAAAIAREWQPQAALMDVDMPVLDGLSATRLIKTAPWGVQVAVIMVSASHTPETIREAVAAGAVAFIAKPFRNSEILVALDSALGITAVEAAAIP